MAAFPLTPANPTNIIPVLDRYGNNYKAPLVAPQLDQADIIQSLTGAFDGILQFSYAIPGYNPDALIQHRGWEVADEMMTHGPYVAPLDVKIGAILYKKHEVIPAVQVKQGNEGEFTLAQEAADYCKFLVENIVWDDSHEETDVRMVIRYMCMAIHQGCSVQEMHTRWVKGGTYDGKLAFSGFSYKRPRQIGYWLDPDTLRVMSINSYTPLRGFQFNVPIEKFLTYTYKPMNALPYGWGDFRPSHKHIIVLDLLTKLWGVILERFAGGFMKGTYTSAGEKGQLIAAMEMIKRGAGIALPEGLELELQQFAGNGVEGIQHAIDYHRRMVTEIILGQSLTTSQGERGSYAHANVHKNTQEFFLAYVRRDIEHRVSNQMFRRMLRFNFGDKYDAVVPRFSLGVWDYDEMALIATWMKTNVDMGALGAKHPVIRERQGLPPYDKSIEGELTIEPDRERVEIGNSSQSNGTKPSHIALYLSTDGIIVPA